MADKTFRIDADITPFQESMRRAAQATQEAAENIQGVFESAFNFAGVAVAIEAISKLKDTIIGLGESAINLQSMSDVLGVTTAQFQTMQFASEEVGVGIETFQRAAEKLKGALDDARQGSSKAIDELHRLGITNAQIADPTFQLNDLMGALHDKLNDASTATSVQAELLKVLGERAVQAVEALKKYDGTEAGVAKSMEDVNGLSDRQIKRLSEMANWWKEVAVWAEHAAAKILVAATTDGEGVNNVRTRLLAEQHAQEAGAAGGSSAGTDAQQQQLQAVAVTAHRIYDQVMGDVLKSEAGQVEATQQGTAARLALAKTFYEDSLKYYGSGTVDAVQRAYAQLQEAQRQMIAISAAGMTGIIQATADVLGLFEAVVKAQRGG